MIRLSAFADEISHDPLEQLNVLQQEGIRYLDLRSAWDTNVLDLDDEQVAELKRLMDGRGVRMAAIGSPVGKEPVDLPAEEHQRRLDRAIWLAHFFDTPLIRVFSFWPRSTGVSIAEDRDAVFERLRRMTERARAEGIILLHENDAGTYGETIERCADVLQGVDDPHFRAVFDPANFIQCGELPYPDAYQVLRRWVRYVHVKDARPDGTVVPAGEGAGQWPEFLASLRADGFDGTFSLEPHLETGGQYGGTSGVEGFRRAAQALKRLLHDMGWTYM
jgi:sugar phosphate isomerase/epimerase